MNTTLVSRFFFLIICIFLADSVTCCSQIKHSVTTTLNVADLNVLFQSEIWRNNKYPDALDAKSGDRINMNQFLQNNTGDEGVLFAEENLDETIVQIYQLLSCKFIEIVNILGNLSRHMARSCQLFADSAIYQNCMETFITTIRRTQSTIREMVDILVVFTPNEVEINVDVFTKSEKTEEDSDNFSIVTNFSGFHSDEIDFDEDFPVFQDEENVENYDALPTAVFLDEIYSEPKTIINFFRFIMDEYQSNDSVKTIIEKIDIFNTNSIDYLHARCSPREHTVDGLSRLLGKYKDSSEKLKISFDTIEHFKKTITNYWNSITKTYLADSGLQQLLNVKPKIKNTSTTVKEVK